MELNNKERAIEQTKKAQNLHKTTNAFAYICNEKDINDQINSSNKNNKNIILYDLKSCFLTNKFSNNNNHACFELLQKYQIKYDCEVYKRMQNKGNIIISKTNQDELSSGDKTEESGINNKVLINHQNKKISPGGSSGGAAVSIYNEISDISFGTDTGGSSRQPASICGIIGFKPSFGTISRHGVVEYAHSLDTIGMFSLSIEKIERIFMQISGQDIKDPSTVNYQYKPYIYKEYRKIKAILYNYEQMSHNQQQFIKNIIAKECDVEYNNKSIISLELLGYMYDIISSVEFMSNTIKYHNNIEKNERVGNIIDISNKMYSKRNEKIKIHNRKKILLGALMLCNEKISQQYHQIMALRTQLMIYFTKILTQYPETVIIYPDKPRSSSYQYEQHTDGYELDYIANFTGMPAISQPIKLKQILGDSVTIMANLYNENLLIYLSKQINKIQNNV